ncbi:FtsX-like permease family protein [Streptomyces sp. NBC_01500]|uniref:ABC transporter permease n=1 Tax=Streptomyces sp. NBC_01500 TaxID=2903886 RepID=UPI002253F3F2|nr:FtsX-like permease family protein [Streptomyces sp. NBC_01500]MCX4547417.1 FtsX-like permease family protein [Streptomyces sp. NBC_01500]
MTSTAENGAPRTRTPKETRRGIRRASVFLAARSLKAHRRAWAAVFAAVALAGTLLGAFAIVIGSLLVAQPPVERYGAADAVVAANQRISYTAKPWGSKPKTATAYLPERAGLSRAVLAEVRGAHGVARAVADDSVPLTLPGGRPAVGRSWPSAALTPYGLTAGRAPTGPGEVVLDTALAHGVRVGGTVRLQIDGPARPYTVSGLASAHRSGSPAVFFTEHRLSALAGHPGTVDAIGVIAEPGVSTGALHDSLRAALPDGSVRVLTGAGRGVAEQLGALGDRDDLLALLASIASTVVMVALLVIAATISQAVYQRLPGLALLRAVGATPRQLRAAVGHEVMRVAPAAAGAGAVGSVPLGLLLRHQLTSASLPLPAPPWLFLAAPLAAAVLVVAAARPVAALAARAVTAVRPAEAMSSAASAEPGEPGRFRLGAGLVMAVVGFGAAGTATLQSGQLAAAAASTSVLGLVVAVALLSPAIARTVTRVLGAPLRRSGGPAGFLAASALTAHARRLGAALTPIVLVVAFVCVQLSAGTTLERATDAGAAAAVRAGLTVDGPPAGLPVSAATAVRHAPGVRAATGVLHSTVVLAHRSAGDPVLDRVPVQGVTAEGLTSLLDPGVTAGDPARLTGRDTVAVGKDRADELGVRPGSTVRLRYGDGTEARLRVVAVYERALGVGDFLLPHDQLAAHMSAPRDHHILVALDVTSDADAVRAALAPYTGFRLRATAAADVRPVPAPDRQGLLVVGVGVIGGFTVLSVISTLVLITVGRRPELALLRLIGARRSQLVRMLMAETALIAVAGLLIGTVVAAVPLVAFGLSVAGTLPYLPPAQYAVIALTVTVAAAAGTLVPALWTAAGRAALKHRTD